MVSNNNSLSWPRQVIAAVAMVGLIVTGCSASTENQKKTETAQEGLEYGATKEEYITALDEMDPVTLTIQSTGPQGSSTGRRFEEYGQALEEWSGGKITIDWAYSNAIASPDEVHLALADGRLDIASVMPTQVPSEFPATNQMWDLSSLGKQTPVDGLLQWHGIMLGLANEAPDIDAEYADHGLKLLLPAFSSGAYMTYCAEPLRGDTEQVVASQGRVQNMEAEALGMTPVTLAYTEMYEGLQRGVADCAFQTVTGAALASIPEVTPHAAYAAEVGLNNAGGSIAMDLKVWESLPLPAQQLLIDRIDVLMQANFEGAWENTLTTLKHIEEEGGSITPMSAEMEASLEALQADVFAEVADSSDLEEASDFVDHALSLEKMWDENLNDLEIPGLDTSYDDFAAWHDEGLPDLDKYFELLWDETMQERRPS